VYAVLTAHGHASVKVPARPLPQQDGLPGGGFFIVEVPAPDSSVWNVTLTDAHGHTVPFANF
jgi:hypothetical protein